MLHISIKCDKFKELVENENYKNKGKWDQLWNLHLKGTLFEYFRGEPEADKKLKELKEAYKNAGEN